jgi:hypothetical protein
MLHHDGRARDRSGCKVVNCQHMYGTNRPPAKSGERASDEMRVGLHFACDSMHVPLLG